MKMKVREYCTKTILMNHFYTETFLKNLCRVQKSVIPIYRLSPENFLIYGMYIYYSITNNKRDSL